MGMIRSMWKVKIKKKQLKNLEKLPVEAQKLFKVLLLDLREKGPVRHDWKNYSKLGKDKYHCHLNYSYVACWTASNEEITIEVYYVGSREKAPY